MSSLGDLFHALPAVRCLKAGLGASVDWVVHDIYADVARCFTDVDRVIGFPRKHLRTGFPEFHSSLRSQAYDYVIDLQGLLKSAFVARLARGDRRIGPSFRREGAGLFYDAVAAPRNKNRHAVEECLDVVWYLGLPLLDPVFPAEFPRRPLGSSRPRVAFLPCSRRRDKNWLPARFIEVGRALQDRKSAVVYLIGSTADRATCGDVESGLSGRVENLCGKTSLVELGSLLQEMDLLVTVDSGPMHMAAALGIPVVAVFGPTFPERTGPYGPMHRVVKQGEHLSVLPAAPVIEAALETLAARVSH
jgi:lipopolysaccharide heptosyltransferase I